MPVSKCSPTGRRAFRRIFPRAIQRLPRKAKGNGHRTYAYSRAVQQPRAGKPREVTAQRPFETRCGAFFRAQFIGSRAARKETDTGLMRTHAPFSSPAPESPAKRPPHALSKRDAAHFSARNSSAPAPLERKRTQDLCVLTRRSAAPRRKPPRAAPSAHAVRRIFPRAIHRLPRRSKGNGHRTYAYSRAVQQPSAPQTSARPSAHAVRLGIAVHGSYAAPPTRSHATVRKEAHAR